MSIKQSSSIMCITLILLPACVYFLVAKWYCRWFMQTVAIASRTLIRSASDSLSSDFSGVSFSTRSSVSITFCSLHSFNASMYCKYRAKATYLISCPVSSHRTIATSTNTQKDKLVETCNKNKPFYQWLISQQLYQIDRYPGRIEHIFLILLDLCWM